MTEQPAEATDGKNCKTALKQQFNKIIRVHTIFTYWNKTVLNESSTRSRENFSKTLVNEPVSIISDYLMYSCLKFS